MIFKLSRLFYTHENHECQLIAFISDSEPLILQVSQIIAIWICKLTHIVRWTSRIASVSVYKQMRPVALISRWNEGQNPEMRSIIINSAGLTTNGKNNEEEKCRSEVCSFENANSIRFYSLKSHKSRYNPVDDQIFLNRLDCVSFWWKQVGI